MRGTIIGDIVGSAYEWHNIKTKDFPLFRDRSINVKRKKSSNLQE